MASKEITPKEAPGQIATPTGFDEIVEMCLGYIDDRTVVFALPEDQGSPASTLANAATLEELDAATEAETTKMEDLGGDPVRVFAFKVLPSDFSGEESLPFYLLASCETKRGHELVSIGGATPVAYILRRYQLGGIPMPLDQGIAFTKPTEPTRSGFYPWNVKRVTLTRDEAGQLF